MIDTYTALITCIKDIQPIKNADFIVSATLAVHNVSIADVVVSKDMQIGDKGLYFCQDVQLSEAYAHANNLVAVYDETGKKIGGGFFDEKRRVRAQRFKGVKSEGLFMPLSSLMYVFDTDYSFHSWLESIEEGMRFQEINGQIICHRYPKNTQNTQNANSGSQNAVKKQLDVLNFPEHYDTPQIIHYLSDIEKLAGSRVVITEKLHGSSHRVGCVAVRKHAPLTFWQRLSNKLAHYFSFLKEYATHYYEYQNVHGSRRVILNDANTGFYGTHDFRYHAVGTPDLHQNEILYGEIVGYVNENTPIMPAHDTKEFKDIKALFPNPMIYNYGCNEGESAFYVYRITRRNDDGIMYDLSYEDVVQRAFELNYASPICLAEIEKWDGDTEFLMRTVRDCAEPNRYFAKSWYGDHISEGVVILFEKGGKTYAYKYKGMAFKVLEGICDMPTTEDEG